MRDISCPSADDWYQVSPDTTTEFNAQHQSEHVCLYRFAATKPEESVRTGVRVPPGQPYNRGIFVGEIVWARPTANQSVPDHNGVRVAEYIIVEP